MTARRATFVLVLTSLWTSTALAGPFHADLGTGGGYDSNIDHAPAGTPPVGAPFADVWGSAGVSLVSAADDELSLDVSGELIQMPTAVDLSSRRVTAGVTWMHFFGDHWLLRATPLAGYRFLVDGTRSGLELGGSASLKLKLTRWLALRLHGSYLYRDSVDPLLAYQTFRGRLSVEVTPWRRARMTLLVSADFSQDVALVPTGYQANLWGLPLPFLADRVGNGVGVALTQDLFKRYFVTATYGFTLAASSLGEYPLHSVYGGAGVRF